MKVSTTSELLPYIYALLKDQELCQIRIVKRTFLNSDIKEKKQFFDKHSFLNFDKKFYINFLFYFDHN